MVFIWVLAALCLFAGISTGDWISVWTSVVLFILCVLSIEKK